MCGFTGLVFNDPRHLPDRAQLRAMSDTIVHRGPDDGVEIVAPGAGLAFRRLSIIDLDGGRQPFVLEGGKLVVSVNGEIYNWRELRAWCEERGAVFQSDSDCEVVPHLYRLVGDRFAERLVGMFAFCVLDLAGDRPRVVLGRDRLGIKPMYWACDGEGLLFGSEAKTLLASGRLARELRPTALLDYLVQGYVGGEDAAWAGMNRLPAGSILSFASGDPAPRIERYWDLPLELRDDPPAEGEILELLDRVVADRMIADVPLGAFLSGGIDSTAVVDSMSRQQEGPVTACSVGFREHSHDELDLARATAQRVGAKHYTQVLDPDPREALEVLPWLFDEPHADPSCLPTWLVSRMAREHVTVALSGDGGDEVFGGYRRYVHDVAENRLRGALGGPGRALAGALGRVYPKLDWAPRFLRARTFLTNVADDPAAAYWRSVTQMDRSEALALLSPDLAASLADHDPFERFEQHYRRPRVDDPLYRAQYADVHTYLTDQILAKVDRASMGVSLEVRVPILDHRFMGRFANLRPQFKVNGGRGKHALREALRGRLPSEVLDGTKRGFDTPLKAWLRGPLAAPVQEAIETLPTQWFRRDVLRARLAEHQAGRRDHGRLLWSLLMLEHWRRRHGVTGLVA
ncbi:asparagine synthase (glutamine-hydrolyzing) [Engelhardtia mirabilis]|uniref:asparagine synthase (glutamine-hydrolyzing) n=1 Tax=Engelhardtia mirabilis TaxID=2528011 RepID=A0A518BKC6_9BACT|nr:Asparagine synthetase [glutamine-hydrolyzing] 1 [Planctomycetes bacterium Pla133]QDV01755.1 Asparagine synthetase [glutamine-hydrolyzing] 1 [Planctomycetes bacterium Pla86]